MWTLDRRDGGYYNVCMTDSYTFQTEVRELLDIVVHALYSEREIFIRELVSNASDALEKLRLKQLTDGDAVKGTGALEISVKTDEEGKSLIISDTGIGMTKEELIENLGTIAHSGTKKFLQALKEKQNSADVIGQFGVGFYSAFMVADKVTVLTRSAMSDTAAGYKWESDGQSGYSIEDAEVESPGTSVRIHLKEEYLEYSQPERVRGILQRYSSFVGFPIIFNGERLNTVEALWIKSKNEVTADEYTDFYKFIAHTDEAPLTHMHFNADAPIDLHALIFVPKDNPEAIGFGRIDPGVALHSRRVLIDSKPEGLLPEWLRFLKGVIDSADLPLNISREMLQDNSLIRKINEVITNRFLKHLEKMSKDESEEYAAFYKLFSRFLKEGIITSWAHKDTLGKLLRFESTMTDAGTNTSFADYISRMKDGQEEIYVLTGPSRAQMENSPYLEAFRARGLEVGFFVDNGDEFVLDALHTIEEKKLVPIDRGDIKLDDIAQEGDALDGKDSEKLEKWLGEVLDARFSKISLSDRLVSSPVVVTQPADAPSAQIREYMKAMGQPMPEVKPNLELNPRNELVKNLASLREDHPEAAKLIAAQLADTALLRAGLLEDPSSLAQTSQDLAAQLIESLKAGK